MCAEKIVHFIEKLFWIRVIVKEYIHFILYVYPISRVMAALIRFSFKLSTCTNDSLYIK